MWKVTQRNMEDGSYDSVEHLYHKSLGKMSDAFNDVWREDWKDPVRSSSNNRFFD
ncbi:hypothetical protein V1519DRAFT_455683 [Lipomyces tetrasporus]